MAREKAEIRANIVGKLRVENIIFNLSCALYRLHRAEIKKIYIPKRQTAC